MTQFSWSDDLYTGNASIDGDHRELIRLINALFKAMDGGHGGNMGKAMHELIAYTEEHFAREEAEMERIQYVAALAHKGEHTKLIRQIVELEKMLDAGGKINVPAVSDFLSAWLRDHIRAADMKLAAVLKLQGISAPAPQAH